MGSIAKDSRQITFFYNSESSLGKQVNAYVNSAEKDVLGVDIIKTKVTAKQWSEIAEGLGKNISDLIDQNHPDFKSAYGEESIDLEEKEWLRLLEKNPSVLVNPIAINGNRYIDLDSAAAFKKYIDADSAGLEKK
jgi:arsenate reductase-like glutaredoxin family protein